MIDINKLLSKKIKTVKDHLPYIRFTGIDGLPSLRKSIILLPDVSTPSQQLFTVLPGHSSAIFAPCLIFGEGFGNSKRITYELKEVVAGFVPIKFATTLKKTIELSRGTHDYFLDHVIIRERFLGDDVISISFLVPCTKFPGSLVRVGSMAAKVSGSKTIASELLAYVAKNLCDSPVILPKTDNDEVY